MPQLLDTSGIPSAVPSGIPDDTQRLQTSPEMFGAEKGQALSQFARGLGDAGNAAFDYATRQKELYEKVAADDGANQFLDWKTKKLYGDPNNKGPDGSPDLGFLGLKGDNAMRARPQLMQEMDDKLTEIRSNLTTDRQRLEFDNYSKRERAVALSQIGSHTDSQSNQFYTNTNKASSDLALNNVIANATDPMLSDYYTDQFVHARVKNAQLQGAQPGDALYEDTVQVAKRDALKAQLNAISVKDPAGAVRLLEAQKAIAGPEYQTLSAHFRTQATDQVARAAANEAYNWSTGRAAQPGAAVHAAVPIINHFEGFRSEPYMDNDGKLRIGWGSDEITKPDGTVVPVSPGARVTREDADRDLARRSANFSAKAQQAIGPNAWMRLSPAAQASITSVTYNYGHVPNSVAIAAQSGDPQQIASSIAGLSGHNGGINAKRRMQEAGNVLGSFSVSGVAAGPTGRTYVLPAGTSGAPQASGAEAPPVQQASYTPAAVPPASLPPTATAPLTAPEPAGIVPHQTPESMRADGFQRIRDMGLDDVAEQKAFLHFEQKLKQDQVIAEQTTRARKEVSESAADEHFKALQNTPIYRANEIMQKILSDPRLERTTREHMLSVASKHFFGEADIGTLGPGFSTAMRQVLADPGDPNKITDPSTIYKLASEGALTLNGADKLIKIQSGAKKDFDQANAHKSLEVALAQQKTEFTHDGEELAAGIKLTDPIGAEKYSRYVNKVMAAYDDWTKAGKRPFEFTDKDNMDKLAEGLKPSAADRAARRIAAAGGAPEAPNAPPPPAPKGVDPKGWEGAFAKRPQTISGAPVNQQVWGKRLQMLIDNPTTETVDAFNRSDFGHKQGLDGATLLKQLTGKEPVVPGAPKPVQTTRVGPIDNPGAVPENIVPANVPGPAPAPARVDAPSTPATPAPGMAAPAAEADIAANPPAPSRAFPGGTERTPPPSTNRGEQFVRAQEEARPLATAQERGQAAIASSQRELEERQAAQRRSTVEKQIADIDKQLASPPAADFRASSRWRKNLEAERERLTKERDKLKRG